MEEPRSYSNKKKSHLSRNEPWVMFLPDCISQTHTRKRYYRLNPLHTTDLTEKSIRNSINELSNIRSYCVIYKSVCRQVPLNVNGDILSSHQSIVAVGHPQKGSPGVPSWITRAVGRCRCLTSMCLMLSMARSVRFDQSVSRG